MEASRNITAPAPSRRLGGDVGQPAQHVTVITTDEPVRVEVGGAPSGRWFKLWNCLVESGAWALFSPAAAKVIVVLAKYANGNPDLACWPGVPTIARDAGLSRSAVFAAISELVSSGWVLRRTVGGGSNATTYQLTEPRGSKRRLRAPSLCSPSLPESSSASNSAPDSASHSGLDPILTDPVRPPTPPQRVLAEYVISTADGQPPPVQQAGPPPSSRLDWI